MGWLMIAGSACLIAFCVWAVFDACVHYWDGLD